MQHNIINALKVSALAAVFSFGLSYALAWTPPSATPPFGNVNAPITTGSVAQTKLGSFTVGTTTAPKSLLVFGTIGATEDICTATGSNGMCLSTATPVGSIVTFAGASTTVPNGYLLADGTAVSRTTYAPLFAVIGTIYGIGNGSTTFNLPDLRGEFVRGLDNGRNVDTGRTLGSYQADAFQAHQHRTYASISYASEGAMLPTGVSYAYQAPSFGYLADGAGTPRNGSETRPRNVALNYIIKY